MPTESFKIGVEKMQQTAILKVNGAFVDFHAKDIVEIVRKKKPRSIGISATTYALPASTTLAERLRKEFPNLLIILGGAHANVAGEDAAKNITSIDIVSYHPEGETVMLDILQKFSNHNFNAVFDKKFFTLANPFIIN